MVNELTLDEQIMAYLRGSITKRGGTARRLSKIQFHMQPIPSDWEFSLAIIRLVGAQKIALEEIEGFGWVYARPL